MEREKLDNWCEKGILGLMLAVLAYSPLAFGAVPQAGFDYFVVVEWLTVAIVAIWFARFCVNSKHRLLWPPVCWPVLAFILYAIGRYFTADIEFVARQELLPPGFRVKTFPNLPVAADPAPRTRFIISDGLAWVSVFIEDGNAGERPGAMRRAEGLVQMGTTAAYSLTAAGHRITVVGDVPADTVRSIAAAIQPE